MNREQQRKLVRQQVAAVQQTDHLRILPHSNEFQLHLQVLAADGKQYHLMLDLDDYDVEPAKLYVLDELGNVTWDRTKLPPPPFLNGSKHPLAQRDFFCIAGTYDYHSHPLHEHERWDGLRNTTTLAGLVASIVKHLRNPAPPKIGILLNGLATVPLHELALFLGNGETAVFQVEGPTSVTLQALEIRFANNQCVRLEVRNAP